jgi:hypothetical protein
VPRTLICSLLLLSILVPGVQGCGPKEEVPKYTEPWVVMRQDTKVLMAPADFAGVIGTLDLGAALLAVPVEAEVSYDTSYAEIETTEGGEGFVERKFLGDAAEWQQVADLRASIRGEQAQATGELSQRANLRLGPGRETRILDSIAGKTPFEMYSRVAIMVGEEKEIWYLVDTGEGRVGYMFTRQLDWDVPKVFPPYTKYRRTVAWSTMGGDEQHPTYIAASIGDGDRDCDFDKVEVYAWDGGGYYATVLVKSELMGVLPLNLEQVEGTWYFEIRTLTDDGIQVQRYKDQPRPSRVVETRDEPLGPYGH